MKLQEYFLLFSLSQEYQDSFTVLRVGNDMRVSDLMTEFLFLSELIL